MVTVAAVLSATVPEPTRDATRRVARSRSTLIRAATNGRRSASRQSAGVPTATRMPRKPISTAAHRRGPTRSLVKRAAAAVSMIGAVK